jgi:hypothetical protein
VHYTRARAPAYIACSWDGNKPKKSIVEPETPAKIRWGLKKSWPRGRCAQRMHRVCEMLRGGRFFQPRPKCLGAADSFRMAFLHMQTKAHTEVNNSEGNVFQVLHIIIHLVIIDSLLCPRLLNVPRGQSRERSGHNNHNNQGWSGPSSNPLAPQGHHPEGQVTNRDSTFSGRNVSSASAHGQLTVNHPGWFVRPCSAGCTPPLSDNQLVPVKPEGARHQKDRVYYPRAVTKFITFISARRVLVAAKPRPRPPALLRSTACAAVRTRRPWLPPCPRSP